MVTGDDLERALLRWVRPGDQVLDDAEALDRAADLGKRRSGDAVGVPVGFDEAGDRDVNWFEHFRPRYCEEGRERGAKTRETRRLAQNPPFEGGLTERHWTAGPGMSRVSGPQSIPTSTEPLRWPGSTHRPAPITLGMSRLVALLILASSLVLTASGGKSGLTTPGLYTGSILRCRPWRQATAARSRLRSAAASACSAEVVSRSRSSESVRFFYAPGR